MDDQLPPVAGYFCARRILDRAGLLRAHRVVRREGSRRGTVHRAALPHTVCTDTGWARQVPRMFPEQITAFQRKDSREEGVE